MISVVLLAATIANPVSGLSGIVGFDTKLVDY